LKNILTKEWIVPLAGLLSWPVVLSFLFIASLSIGTGGGSFQGMAMLFYSMGLIVLINLASFIATAVIWFKRRGGNEPVGRPVKIGLIYYALVLAICLTIMGPRELINDSAIAVGSLFR
jgi:hypothetical protein